MSTETLRRDLGLARNGLGQALAEGSRARLAAAVQSPGQLTWDAAYSIILNRGGTTLWQAVLVVDPGFRAVKGPATRYVNDADGCVHSENDWDFEIQSGTFDYVSQVCLACRSARPVHDDDDQCETCLAGGFHPWQPDPERDQAIREPWARTPAAWAIRQAIEFATH